MYEHVFQCSDKQIKIDNIIKLPSSAMCNKFCFELQRGTNSFINFFDYAEFGKWA